MSDKKLQDNLDLPQELVNELDKIIVKRRGDSDHAYMITRDVVGYVAPNIKYQVTLKGLIAQDDPAEPSVTRSSSQSIPHHCALDGHWEKVESKQNCANILGGFGTLTIDQETASLQVPIAKTTKETLAFYGAILLKQEDHIAFDCDADLPVTFMSVGPDYAKGYLLDEEKGGGCYLEYHDRPHFHMPLNESCGGFLILGKKLQDDILLSAFQIPWRHAIYTPPNVIHTDAYLTGDFLVVYSVTKNYSTVILKNKRGELIDIKVK